jgi:hypothetical protein
LIEKTAISEDEKIDNLSVKNTDKIHLQSTEKTPELVDEILQALSHQIIDDFESKLPTESSTKLPDKTGVDVINFLSWPQVTVGIYKLVCWSSYISHASVIDASP